MTWAERVSILLAGVFVGCLTGLSVSPVVGVVVSGLVAAITTVVSALASPPATEPAGGFAAFTKSLRPGAVAWLAGGVLLGAVAGLWAREHRVFVPSTPDPKTVAAGQQASLRQELAFWKSLGLEDKKVAQALFDRGLGHAAEGKLQQVALAGLYADELARASRCTELRAHAANEATLRDALVREGAGSLVAGSGADANFLHQLVDFACPEKQP